MSEPRSRAQRTLRGLSPHDAVEDGYGDGALDDLAVEERYGSSLPSSRKPEDEGRAHVFVRVALAGGGSEPEGGCAP